MQKKVQEKKTATHSSTKVVYLNTPASANKDALISKISDFILHKQVKDNTAENYISAIKNFILGCDDIHDWKSVQFYINSLREEKKDSTANRQSVVIKDFLSFLDSHTEFENDSWRKITIKKFAYRGGNGKIIPDDKFVEMYKHFDMNNINEIRDFALLKVFQSCGLRLHEPFQIKLKDIQTIQDKEGNNIYVFNSLQKNNIRFVSQIFPGTYRAIRKYIIARGIETLTDDYLFIQHKFNRDNTKPMDSSVFAKKLKVLFEAVGLHDYSAHDIRYTAAIKTLQETGSESLASQKLNHISPKTIQYYTADYRLNINAIHSHNIEINSKY